MLSGFTWQGRTPARPAPCTPTPAPTHQDGRPPPPRPHWEVVSCTHIGPPITQGPPLLPPPAQPGPQRARRPSAFPPLGPRLAQPQTGATAWSLTRSRPAQSRGRSPPVPRPPGACWVNMASASPALGVTSRWLRLFQRVPCSFLLRSGGWSPGR